MITKETPQTHINTPRQVLFASMVGTTVEFFDFYIYATAAVLVFPRLFFPASDPASSTLASLATFGIAFLARPIGSALFGHFGDRIGRKKTLVLALSTMGLSTFAIGALLPHELRGPHLPRFAPDPRNKRRRSHRLTQLTCAPGIIQKLSRISNNDL
jgi:MFS family permease